MIESIFLNELVSLRAERSPHSIALTYGGKSLTYACLHQSIHNFASGLLGLGLLRGDRIGIYIEKRFETVIASFGAASAGLVFVPINPLLKPEQVAYILRDCQVRLLVTSPDRLALMKSVMAGCQNLYHVVLTAPRIPDLEGIESQHSHHLIDWSAVLNYPTVPGHRVIDTDMVAIFYTSGSTGLPRGVVLSHRNMVAGAKSVASYLENNSQDTLLAVLPLSFDAGFSQLTTAFHVGARAVLLNYLVPRDVLMVMEQEGVTGLTAVPPLYIELAKMTWPDCINEKLRYFANTGGHMPLATLNVLRKKLPRAKPFLMYGLTEAFRSTYLPPEEIDRRPDSIGRAIPNAEILVLREDGTPCAPDEPGELVHRGALVGLGYWNDAEKTAERYKILHANTRGRPMGLTLPEYAVFSGDTVRRDSEGFLYFICRRDDMMKTSGYRVSPSEVEEFFYASGQIGECIAFGVAHASLGHSIQVIATPADGVEIHDIPNLLKMCRLRMPAYMVPAGIEMLEGPLPRNPNGKIDRKLLAVEWAARQLKESHA